MAYVGIDGDPYPNCGSTATTEVHKPTVYPEREVCLKCLECKKETLVGVYKSEGNSLVRVR